jgi:hypothetical protein
MKKSCFTTIVVVFLLLFSNEIQAQTTLTESPKAGSEYNVLDAWSGIWNIQVEARDSISAPYYHVDWTLNGHRILNGYALEVIHLWKTKNLTQNGIEITGYDPSKKECMTHIFYDSDGSWINTTPTFTDKRTCIENGTMYFPNGKVQIFRMTWKFSENMMSVDVKGENMNNNIWWIQMEGKGTKTYKK